MDFWEKNSIDVLICTAISGSELMFYECAEARTNMTMNFPKDLKVVQMKFPEPCIDITRDKAVQIAIQNGARWIWFLDSDIICPPDTLQRLIAHDKPIVGGLYVRRHFPVFSEMLRFRKDGVQGLEPIKDGEYVPGELVECDTLATGCTLYRTDVFSRVPPHQITIDGQQARPAWFLWTEWRLPVGLSEDFEWGSRCSRHGIKSYCDTSIVLRHAGPVKLLPSFNGSLNLEFMGQG